ncbi:hypothetical protein SAMN06298210_104126 [Prevotellaceae bacterium KH2P17]|nr:hypothetical protein SAMN06298210_104126 [Prevotellaceae bacterium KH2P17]
MKKFIIALTALLTLTVSVSAMSYEQAREQALFLTDKMAYELNLTDDQYEAAYEINLDYLMGISDYNDIYGAYWTQRNLDLSYILLDWQYRAFCAANYFYRPLYWDGGYWHFRVYARYPHRTYYYFGRPHFYTVYRGGHSWRSNGGRSWYNGRSYGQRHNDRRIGMRDGFDRGDYGKGRTFGGRSRDYGRNNANYDRDWNRQNQNRRLENRQNRTFGGRADNNLQRNNTMRQSSTRATERGSFGERSNRIEERSSGSFGRPENQTPNRTFTPSRSAQERQTAPTRSFGSPSRSNGNFGESRSRGSFGESRSNGSFGNMGRSNGSFGSSRNSGSFGSAGRSGGSFGSMGRSGGATRGGGSSNGHFGGHR